MLNVVIPIYKSILSKDEEASLRQCLDILSSHPIRFICPDNLDISNYISILSKYDVNIDFIRFDTKFFKSIKAYNDLMLNVDLYKTFENYKFMLLYQLDAWVFSDELDDWCLKGYDYIGAPWFVGYNIPDKNTRLQKFAGNGGFSLRCINKFIDVLTKINSHKYDKVKVQSLKELNSELNLPWLKKYKLLKKYFSKKNLLKYYLQNVYEDIVVEKCFNKVNKDFKLAESNVALKFSFEVHPEILFKMNSNKLPFGCHAFKKYNYSFWKQYIELD